MKRQQKDSDDPIGMRMLLKMGYKPGTGLGKTGKDWRRDRRTDQSSNANKANRTWL